MDLVDAAGGRLASGGHAQGIPHPDTPEDQDPVLELDVALRLGREPVRR